MTRISTIAPGPHPAASIDDNAIIAAWERLVEARKIINALQFDDHPQYEDKFKPEEKRQWAICDAAEIEIQTATATTPEGAAIQIKTALLHSLDSEEEDEALLNGDLAPIIEREADLDWNVRLMLAAYRSLETMGA